MYTEIIKGAIGAVTTFGVLTFVLIVFVIVGIKLSLSVDVHLDSKYKKDA